MGRTAISRAAIGALIMCFASAATDDSPAGRRIHRFSLARRVITDAPVARDVTLRRLAGRPADMRFGRMLQNEVELYGDYRAIAYFYANIYVGSQRRRVSVITDTGSAVMAFPCAMCTTCGKHQNYPRYDPAQSTTASEIACKSDEHDQSDCTYSQRYMEGSSLRGKYYRDHVYLGDVEEDANTTLAHQQFRLDFTFGCHTYEDGLFTEQLADGIMGMTQDARSFIFQLAEQHVIERNIFSLCLTLRGGAMTMGAMDAALHAEPPKWAALSHSSGHYVVTVDTVGVAGITVADNEFGTTILDSGTTFTYMPRSIAQRLRNEVLAFCAAESGRCRGQKVTVKGEEQNLCFRLSSPDDIHTFPPITFSLRGVVDGTGTPEGVHMVMPPAHAFVNMGFQDGAFCLSIYDNAVTSTTLGANFMMGSDVVFEMDTQGAGLGRVGFARSSCLRQDGHAAASQQPTVCDGMNTTGCALGIEPLNDERYLSGVAVGAGAMFGAIIFAVGCCWCATLCCCGRRSDRTYSCGSCKLTLAASTNAASTIRSLAEALPGPGVSAHKYAPVSPADDGADDGDDGTSGELGNDDGVSTRSVFSGAESPTETMSPQDGEDVHCIRASVIHELGASASAGVAPLRDHAVAGDEEAASGGGRSTGDEADDKKP